MDKKYTVTYSVDKETEDYIKNEAIKRFGGNESLALRMIATEHKLLLKLQRDLGLGFGRGLATKPE
jgi:hypothetical protein